MFTSFFSWRGVQALFLSAVILFVPLWAQAATIPQIVEKSFEDLSKSEPRFVSYEVEYSAKVEPAKRGQKLPGDTDMKFKLQFETESFPRSESSSQDGIIRMRIPYYRYGAMGGVVEGKNPFIVELRLIGKDAYVRVTDPTPEVRQGMQDLLAVDPALVFDTWIHFSVDDLTKGMQNEVPSVVPGLTPEEQEFEALWKAIKKGPIIKVIRVEKRYKKDGNQMVRARIGLHPNVLNVLQKQLEKKAPKDRKERAAYLKDLRKQMADTRKAVAKIQAVVVVNETEQSLERVEASYSDRQPEYTYEYTKGREKKKLNNYLKTTVVFAMNIRPIADRIVERPESSLSFDDFLKRFEPATPIEPTPVPPEPLPVPAATTTVSLRANDHIRGRVNARVTLVEYADFECPFCKRHQDTMLRALADFPLDVRSVFRHYPLTSIHPYAQKAAESTECAAKLGGETAFWRMHDRLFEVAPNFATSTWYDLAREQGLDEVAFRACLDTGEMQTRVTQDFESGTALGVQGTPHTFINGLPVSGAVPYDQFRSYILQALGTN